MHLAANVYTVEDQPVLAHDVNLAAHELPLQLVQGAEMHGTMRAVQRGGVPHQNPANLNVPTGGRGRATRALPSSNDPIYTPLGSRLRRMYVIIDTCKQE